MNVNLFADSYANNHILSLEQIPIFKEKCEGGLLPWESAAAINPDADEEILKTTAKLLGMRYANIEKFGIDRDLVKLYNVNALIKYSFLPLERKATGEIVFATSSPYNLAVDSVIRTGYSENIEYVFVSKKGLMEVLNRINAVTDAQRSVSRLNQTVAEQAFTPTFNAYNIVDDEVQAVNSDVSSVVNSILRQAISAGASDIHIEPYEKTAIVRFRILGDLSKNFEITMDHYPNLVARLKIIAGMEVSKTRIPQDGKIAIAYHNEFYDVRVSSVPTIWGERFVLRILDKNFFNKSRAELNFSEKDNELVDKMISAPNGIILMTGPTGCGKSTTLYALIKEIQGKKPEANIMTIEEPVEFTMPGIAQTQVNYDLNLTFPIVLRSFLRQDPNIILVGEIRDEETAQTAVQAAMTGHLILSTLHTNDATGAINRLTDMGVPYYYLSDSLRGIIAQRLIKKLCPTCKQAYTASETEMKRLGIDYKAQLFRRYEKGCIYCNHTGYSGRIAVHETLLITPDIVEAIENKKTHSDLVKIAEKNGMTSLKQSCINEILEGNSDIKQLEAITME